MPAADTQSNIVCVDFHGDTLAAVVLSDGIYVALRPICDFMGLVWRKQQERVTRDPILREAITMMVAPFGHHGQEETCLRLDFVNGWLFTIDESRVKNEEIRQKVLAYKRECYRVLFDHFYGKALGGRAKESDASKLRKVAECRKTMGHRAAAALWVALGLDVVPEMMDGRQRPAQPRLHLVQGEN